MFFNKENIDHSKSLFVVYMYAEKEEEERREERREEGRRD